MSQIKVWPHMTIMAVLVALIAGLGVAFYMKHEQKVQASALPNAARIQRVDGEVAFSDGLNPATENAEANTQWTAATVNQPFSVGDRIYTRDNARTSLAFTGRNFARLNPNTELDVIDLSDNRTQLALRDGSAMFDVGYLNPGELFEVGTPYGAVDFDQPGLYNVGFDNNGSVLVSVLSGLAQVVGLGGSGRISKGEILTLAGATAAQVLLGRLNGNDAGYLVDDYYRYQYSNYDGRYSSYDAYLNDPYYYDPYRYDPSYQYASGIIPGLNDLTYYGDWQNLSGYGYAWRPRVDAAWVPYQQGYWATDYPYGPTWVSSEPWGYAPYHYGRWANVGNQWFWVPDAVNTTPVYSPALVAFLPLTDSNQIGWVPLGPGDAYAPRYYDANWQPYYLTRTDLAPAQLVNLGIPNAVTVVPVDYYGRTIDPRIVTRVDRQMLAQVRPTLDPLLLTPLRNAVVHSAWGRGKIDLPPGIAKKLNDTRVIVGTAPATPPFGKHLAKNLRVDAVPDKVKSQKLNVRDERQNASAQAPGRQSPGQTAAPGMDVARKQQEARLAAEAAKGSRDARKQLQQLEQQQRKQAVEQQQAQRRAEQQAQQEQRRAAQQAQQEQRRAAQQAQGARVRQPAAQQPQREIMRPQRPQAEPRRAAPTQPRLERPQPRAPHGMTQPEPARQAAPEQRQAPQRQERSGPPQKAEKHGPPAQPAAQPQGQPGGGKGKGKKP
ncbi:MAG TPA: DUF6600 domain-containing protein [Pyrinomonadaceae bacterium]|nr:DUF6600 domain-containing protein [Pyrinomonadaceae bacterium]